MDYLESVGLMAGSNLLQERRTLTAESSKRKNHPRRSKPARPTVLSKTTARRLAYLERHGLADFAGSNFKIADSHFVNKNGERVKFKHGLQHHGGV
jgi:hypothetical protein